MERALETQRVKLLRLLAGWVAVVEVLSLGPLQIELPRWVRSFFVSILTRAEFAAQSLVFVSACLSRKNGSRGSVREGSAASREMPRAVPIGCADDVPSTKALLHRMNALRALLRGLRRHRFRLTQRRAVGRNPRSVGCSRSLRDRWIMLAPWPVRDARVIQPKVERPPDKSCQLSVRSLDVPPPDFGREATVFAKCCG